LLLLWPSRTETFSKVTPASSISTAKVSLSMCGCALGMPADLKMLFKLRHQDSTGVSALLEPFQRK
jgi:hypothetical protein